MSLIKKIIYILIVLIFQAGVACTDLEAGSPCLCTYTQEHHSDANSDYVYSETRNFVQKEYKSRNIVRRVASAVQPEVVSTVAVVCRQAGVLCPGIRKLYCLRI